MPYGARVTNHPHEDIKRDWTGAQHISAPTEDEAVRAIVRANNWEREWWRDYEESEYYEHGVDMWENEEFIDKQREEYGISPRELPNGRWGIFDHWGIAVWLIRQADGEDPESDEEALRLASDKREKYLHDFEDNEGGYATWGKIRYVGKVPLHGLVKRSSREVHVFWADDIIDEDEARTDYNG